MKIYAQSSKMYQNAFKILQGMILNLIINLESATLESVSDHCGVLDVKGSKCHVHWDSATYINTDKTTVLVITFSDFFIF